MKNCVKCQKEIGFQDAFCPHCGSNQLRDEIMDRLDRVESNINNTVKSENTGLLVTLGVLSIVGSIFGMSRGLLYEAIAGLADSGSSYTKGYIYVFANLGSMIGVILMLSRKIVGLYAYTLAQIVYVVTVMISSMSYEEGRTLAVAVSSFFMIPSVVFVFLFWSKGVKDKLS